MQLTQGIKYVQALEGLLNKLLRIGIEFKMVSKSKSNVVHETKCVPRIRWVYKISSKLKFYVRSG